MISSDETSLTAGQLSVLDVLANASRSLTVSELANQSGVKSTTLRNYLTAFRADGRVIVDSSEYPITVSLGTKISEYSGTTSRSRSTDQVIPASDAASRIIDRVSRLENALRQLSSVISSKPHLLCADGNCNTCRYLKDHIIDETVVSISRAANWCCEHEIGDRLQQIYGRWVEAGKPLEGYDIASENSIFDPVIAHGGSLSDARCQLCR